MLVSNIATASTAPITHHEFFVESAYDGLKISVLEVTPTEKPKAVVFLAHGLCGCKERFLPFMEYLAMNGIACVANDHRGHGSSIHNEEDRGYTYHGGAKAMVMDMEIVAEYIGECKAMGIAVLPPDVNRSCVHFTVDGKDDITVFHPCFNGTAACHKRNGFNPLFMFCHGDTDKIAFRTFLIFHQFRSEHKCNFFTAAQNLNGNGFTVGKSQSIKKVLRT